MPEWRTRLFFSSTDAGQTWEELSGLGGRRTGPRWQPGAGGMCLHTILLDQNVAGRMFIAISAAGAFRSDDAGKTWKPINRGLRSEHIPDPLAEVGHCVHRIAMHRARPGVLYMQKHWDVMRSNDAGDSWQEVSGNLPTDFGFVIDVHAHEPETVYVVPIKSDSEHFPMGGKLRVFRSRTGGNEWEPLTKGLPQSDCYVNVLRDAMAVDSTGFTAAFISGPRAGRFTRRQMPGTPGRRSCAICRRCFPSRCRRSHDPGFATGASSNTGARGWRSPSGCRVRCRRRRHAAAVARRAGKAISRCCEVAWSRSGDAGAAARSCGLRMGRFVARFAGQA